MWDRWWHRMSRRDLSADSDTYTHTVAAGVPFCDPLVDDKFLEGPGKRSAKIYGRFYVYNAYTYNIIYVCVCVSVYIYIYIYLYDRGTRASVTFLLSYCVTKC